jgi:hypothetical protein
MPTRLSELQGPPVCPVGRNASGDGSRSSRRHRRKHVSDRKVPGGGLQVQDFSLDRREAIGAFPCGPLGKAGANSPASNSLSLASHGRNDARQAP